MNKWRKNGVLKKQWRKVTKDNNIKLLYGTNMRRT